MTLIRPRRLMEWPEHEYIHRALPRHGYRYVAHKIGRHPSAVWAYGDRHGIRFGDITGFIRLAGLEHRTGTNYSHLYQRAKADGVLKILGPSNAGTRSRAALVPQDWADYIIAEVEAKQAGDELIEEANWLTVPDLMRAWKLGKSTILRGLNGTGVVAQLLEQENVRTGQASGYHRTGKWIVEPHGAERVRRRLEHDRNRARELISTKSISVEAGVSQTYAADVGRELGGELLFVHGRWMRHVTPEVADMMRARFRKGKTLSQPLDRAWGSRDHKPRRCP